MNNDIIYERKNLENTIVLFNNSKKSCNKRVEKYIKNYNENPLLYEKLIYELNHKINVIDKAINKPYFARIDFKVDNCVQKYYIGKIGIMDDDNNPITVDWRSPIAALYYDSNIGEAKYLAPEGEINGSLLLKRQLEIDNQELKFFQDVDTVANDELLKPYLNANFDNRLKNIVSTIQKEQNTIIRENILNNIIVQGVAGSGKTTVALHRVAYLAYNYQNNIKDYLVIGPNRYFVKYISNVLPDLDVDDVKQIIYEDFIKAIIKNKISINESSINLLKALNKENLDFEKYKVSKDFYLYVKDYMDTFINNYHLKGDLKINDYPILKNSLISEYYLSINDNEILSSKVERTINLLSNYVKNNKSYYLNHISERFLKNNDKEEYTILKNKLNNYFKQDLKEYFNIKNINIINIYKDIIASVKNYDTSYTIKNLNKKKIDNEDIPAIIYIYYRIFGNNLYKNIKHTVIDEAQDYGYFNFIALKKLLSNSTFSIYGDLAQSLYSYKSIKSWDEILDIFDNSKLCYLNKSYRSTIEIVTFANKINKHLNLNLADAVIRHGKQVNVKKFNNIMDIENVVNDYYQKGYIHIAIITKNLKELNYYKNNLNKDILKIVTIITSYDSKGLEYDVVIIPSINFKTYDYNNILDMKLLYVAMTRALHELTLFYEDAIPEYLED